MDVPQITDGDTLVLHPHQEGILQKCCGCGLWHIIMIKRNPDGRILMTFNRLKGEPDPEDYDLSTEIVSGS